MEVPAFVESTISNRGRGSRMSVNGAVTIRHVFDVLQFYKPTKTLAQIETLTLSRNIPDPFLHIPSPLPLNVSLFTRLVALTLESMEWSATLTGQMPSVRHVTITNVKFRAPANIFPFLLDFPSLEHLEMREVTSDADVKASDIEIPMTLNRLVVTGTCSDSVDFWFLGWMMDNRERVPFLNLVRIEDIDDEGSDTVNEYLLQEMYNLRKVEVTIKRDNEYAWERLTRPDWLPRTVKYKMSWH